MNLTDVLSATSGGHKKRKRVGRGTGSGHGKTAGRGHKGQKSRSGYHRRGLAEGGQMTLIRRIPKRGFRNPAKVIYKVVNVGQLKDFPRGSIVDAEKLRQEGFFKGPGPLKILGAGDLPHPLTVRAHAFSQSARRKIESAGGRAEVLQ